MSKDLPLTQRELDILFGFLAPSFRACASLIYESGMFLDYVTLEINGHSYKVGIDIIRENCFDDPKFVISIPCEVMYEKKKKN